jgi:hypothetical protein
MNTPTIESNINRLRSEVFKYGSGKIISMDSILISGIWIYIGISIFVLLLLIVIRPGFVKYEIVNDNGDVSKKISYKKIFIYWIVISIIIIVGVYGYNYKMNEG